MPLLGAASELVPLFCSIHRLDDHYPSSEPNLEEGAGSRRGAETGASGRDAITAALVRRRSPPPPRFCQPSMAAGPSAPAKTICRALAQNKTKSFPARIAVVPFCPAITMLDHHYPNGGALAFQGAFIKEGKKSCSQWGEIHFVPGSNICCSQPSQKDVRIKPKSH